MSALRLVKAILAELRPGSVALLAHTGGAILVVSALEATTGSDGTSTVWQRLEPLAKPIMPLYG
eukprot:scaffold103369_cov67-Attheya_sp.AAC.3